MKKKHIILISALSILLLVTVIFICHNIWFSIHKNDNTVTIIGGADGPTSMFVVGTLGGSGGSNGTGTGSSNGNGSGTGKTSGIVTQEGDGDMASYKSISMEEAKTIFAEKGDYIILDVRRADEFAEGHIPGAMNIANEDIGTKQPAELPNMDQVIYVYCRSGRRSKEAAEKLYAMGYSNIIECGGILDWTGEIEKER